ncbi:hypothetical protein [Mucilaginibacter limnophilus]|nr:hypothetical protein [Mucilaginibacter limnophilus]
MKRIALAVLVIGASILTSCKKENDVKPVAPVQTFIGFKKDISSAD